MVVIRYLCALALILPATFLRAQDSAFTKKRLNETEVKALLSYYTQTGNHSAVTGGEGSETMQVYSAKLHYRQTVNDKNTYSFDLGADIISSASTDRIDFVMSSASRIDQHTTVGIGFARNFHENVQAGISYLGGIESDYFSNGGEAYFTYNSADLSRSYSLNVKVFFDDLRWGRLHAPVFKGPYKLIYPQELRGTEWFDTYTRHTYNFAFSFRQDVNSRLMLAFYPLYTYQAGLLSTPFHRVYFSDGSERVENLPAYRNQMALGFRLNYFYGNTTILRSFYQVFSDDFGLWSQTLQLEHPVKISPKHILSPQFRVYWQSGSRFFQPYGLHSPAAGFYTSDYDLSRFWSVNTGLTFTLLRSAAQKLSGIRMGNFSARYSFYYRDDGLKAHIISTFLTLDRQKSKTKLK